MSQRGGIDAGEAIAIISGLSHRAIGFLGTADGVEAAHRILYSMRSLYRRESRALAPSTSGQMGEAE